MPELIPRYNIAPATEILIIRETGEGRIGSMARWGFIPRWAKNGVKVPMLNNARAETIATKPMFKAAFRIQRCIIPASGFYEWQLLRDGEHKQPYFISTTDGCPISFAGILETSISEGKTSESCAIITTRGNDLMRPIHDRMPVILPPESFDTWLRPNELPDVILNFYLNPHDSNKMQSWPVSTAVNRSTNEGQDLILADKLIFFHLFRTKDSVKLFSSATFSMPFSNLIP